MDTLRMLIEYCTKTRCGDCIFDCYGHCEFELVFPYKWDADYIEKHVKPKLQNREEKTES